MNKEQKIKLLKALPLPDDLKGLLPQMNQQKMLVGMLSGDPEIRGKIADMTLLAILIATVKLIMQNNPNWEQYIDTGHVENEVDVPEPCGDPECEGCKQLEAALKHAAKHGGSVKAVSLTKQQAMDMGFIDENGNDIQKDVGHCIREDDDDGTDKVVH